MRLPWIKVYQDGLVKCRTLARLLKIPTAHGIGIGNMIWSWGLDMAPENDAGDIDLRGHLSGDAAELIAAAVEWDGDQQRLWQVLCQVGLCAESKGSTPARIKGLKLYAEVLEERKRDRDRKKRARSSRGSPAEFRRTSAGVPPSDRDRDRDRSSKEEGLAILASSAASPAAPSPVGFFPWMRATRVTVHAELKQESPPPQVTLDRLADAERRVGRDELERRYLTYLEVEYWAAGKPPWHANGFAKCWDQCPPAPKQLRLEPGPALPKEFLDVLELLRAKEQPYLASQLASCSAELAGAELVLTAPDPYFAGYLREHLAATGVELPHLRIRPEAS